jgi:hypothetical protein
MCPANWRHSEKTHCGSTAREFTVAVGETLDARDWLRARGYQEGVSRRKGLLFDARSFPDVVRSRGGVRAQRDMTMDKARDRYTEAVTILDTGEVIHHHEEPLSRHTGLGAAKHKVLTSAP